MNVEERKEFWKLLCSLKGENVKSEADELLSMIKFPRFLYRYRSVNSNTLEALRTNTLYYSSANYYDDPFDTFLNINLNGITEQLQKGMDDPRYLEFFLKEFNQDKYLPIKSVLGLNGEQAISEDALRGLFNANAVKSFIDKMGEFRNIIKEDTWSICFSENGINENLWLKYANQHKGFALMYALEKEENFICGKDPKCDNCAMNYVGKSLYPVCYSNEKYDATSFAQYIIKRKLEEKFNYPDLLDGIMPVSDNQTWEREKIALIKRECHHYDEEWRIVTVAPPNSHIFLKWKPVGIILGLKMEPNEENLVITLAKQAGIQSIYKSKITNDGNLDVEPLSL